MKIFSIMRAYCVLSQSWSDNRSQAQHNPLISQIATVLEQSETTQFTGNMEQSVPNDWLSRDFLTQCLAHEENNQNVVITNFTTSEVVPPGNNYGSCLVRVKVEYKNDPDDNKLHFLSLIIKSETLDESVKEVFGDDLKGFEHIFYNRFVRKAKELTNISFFVNNLFSPISSVLVLEDLKEKGFVMADRLKGLDFEHCCLYINASATLHALSFAVHKKHPELIESMGKEKLFAHDLNSAVMFKNSIKRSFECLADITEQSDKLSKYSKVIRECSPVLWDMVVEAHKPSEVINTINQGDPWTTNMMFKYDAKGTVCQIKLLDFQALRYGSPINDLVFFVWTGANHDVRKNRLNEIYQLYLHVFNSKLKELSCTERLTYQSFMDNVRKLNPLALMIAVTILPSMYYPSAADMSEFTKVSEHGENPYKKFYNESYCNIHLSKMIEQLELAGVFEYMENYKKRA